MKEIKKEVITYKDCEITFTINENDGKYSAHAAIQIPDNPTLDKMEILPDTFDSIEEAEKKIVSVAKKWVDDVVFSEKLKKSDGE
jgi:hypothetical protein